MCSILGIAEIQQELRSWEWIYGKTPRFTLIWPTGEHTSQVHIHVNRGLIEEIDFSKLETDSSHFKKFADLLINKKIDKKLHDALSSNNTIYSDLNDSWNKLIRLLLELCDTTA